VAQNVKSQCQNLNLDSAQVIGEGHFPFIFVNHLVILFGHGAVAQNVKN